MAVSYNSLFQSTNQLPQQEPPQSQIPQNITIPNGTIQTDLEPIAPVRRALAVRPQIQWEEELPEAQKPRAPVGQYFKEFGRGVAGTVLGSSPLYGGQLANIVQKELSEVGRKYKSDALMQSAQSVGYSVAATIPGIAAEILINKTPWGRYAKLGAAGVVGYVTLKSTYEQTLNNWYNMINDDWMKQYGRTMTHEEWNQAKDQFGLRGKAAKEALWEAGTEAAGYFIGSKLFPFSKGLAKTAIPKLVGGTVYEQAARTISPTVKEIVKPTLARKAITFGKRLGLSQISEQAEELIANKNQADVEYELGLTDKPTYMGTLKQQAAPVAISTLALNALFGGATKGVNLYTKHKINTTVEDNDVNAGNLGYKFINGLVTGTISPDEVRAEAEFYSEKPKIKQTILRTIDDASVLMEAKDDPNISTFINLTTLPYKFTELENKNDQKSIDSFVYELPFKPDELSAYAEFSKDTFPKVSRTLTKRANDIIETQKQAAKIKADEEGKFTEDIEGAETFPSGITLTQEGKDNLGNYIESRGKMQGKSKVLRTEIQNYAQNYSDWKLGILPNEPIPNAMLGGSINHVQKKVNDILASGSVVGEIKTPNINLTSPTNIQGQNIGEQAGEQTGEQLGQEVRSAIPNRVTFGRPKGTTGQITNVLDQMVQEKPITESISHKSVVQLNNELDTLDKQAQTLGYLNSRNLNVQEGIQLLNKNPNEYNDKDKELNNLITKHSNLWQQAVALPVKDAIKLNDDMGDAWVKIRFQNEVDAIHENELNDALDLAEYYILKNNPSKADIALNSIRWGRENEQGEFIPYDISEQQKNRNKELRNKIDSMNKTVKPKVISKVTPTEQPKYTPLSEEQTKIIQPSEILTSAKMSEHMVKVSQAIEPNSTIVKDNNVSIYEGTKEQVDGEEITQEEVKPAKIAIPKKVTAKITTPVISETKQVVTPKRKALFGKIPETKPIAEPVTTPVRAFGTSASKQVTTPTESEIKSQTPTNSMFKKPSEIIPSQTRLVKPLSEKLKGDDVYAWQAQSLGIRTVVTRLLDRGETVNAIVERRDINKKIKGRVDNKTLTEIVNGIDRLRKLGKVPKFKGTKLGLTEGKVKEDELIPLRVETKTEPATSTPTPTITPSSKQNMAVELSRDEYTEQLTKDKLIHFTIRKDEKSKRHSIYFDNGEIEIPMNDMLDKQLHTTFASEQSARNFLNKQSGEGTNADRYLKILDLQAESDRETKFAVEREHRDLITRLVNSGQTVSEKAISAYKDVDPALYHKWEENNNRINTEQSTTPVHVTTPDNPSTVDNVRIFKDKSDKTPETKQATELALNYSKLQQRLDGALAIWMNPTLRTSNIVELVSDVFNKGYTYDFNNKRIVSKDGKFAIQWKVNEHPEDKNSKTRNPNGITEFRKLTTEQNKKIDNIIKEIERDKTKQESGNKTQLNITNINTISESSITPILTDAKMVNEIDSINSAISDKFKSPSLGFSPSHIQVTLNRLSIDVGGKSDQLKMVKPRTLSDKIARIVANTFGDDVIFFEKSSDYAGLPFTGAYHRGFIFLESDNTNKIIRVIGHELGHKLRNRNPQLYNQLKNYLYSNERTEIDRLIKSLDDAVKNNPTIAPKWNKLNYDNKLEEIISDLVADRITNPNFWIGLSNYNSSTFNKLHNIILRILTRLSNLMNKQTLKTHFKDITSINNLIDSVMYNYAQEQRMNASVEKLDTIQTKINNIQSTADAFINKVPIVSNVTSIPNVSYLPQSILNRIINEDTNIDDISHMYDHDSHTIYLIANNLKTPYDIQRIILGASIKFDGIQGTFGNKMNGILRNITNLYKDNDQLSNRLSTIEKLGYLQSLKVSSPSSHYYHLSLELLNDYINDPINVYKFDILYDLRDVFNSLGELKYSNRDVLDIMSNLADYNTSMNRDYLIDTGLLDASHNSKLMVDTTISDSPYRTDALKQLPVKKLISQHGDPVGYFHATNRDFKVSDFYPFSHFGTEKAALKRMEKLGDYVLYTADRKIKTSKGEHVILGDSHTLKIWVEMGLSRNFILNNFKSEVISKPHLMPVYLAIENPIRIKDSRIGEFTPSYIAHELTRVGVMTPEQNTEFRFSIPLSFQPEYLKNIIKSKGYDGIIYKNNYEDIGKDSYIPMDNSQVISALVEVNPAGQTNTSSSWTVGIDRNLLDSKFMIDPKSYANNLESNLTDISINNIQPTDIEKLNRLQQAMEYFKEQVHFDTATIAINAQSPMQHRKFKSFDEATDIKDLSDMRKVPDAKSTHIPVVNREVSLEKEISLPFYYMGHSQHLAERYIYRAASIREDEGREYENIFMGKKFPENTTLLDKFIELKKTNKPEYEKLSNVIVHADINEKKYTEQDLRDMGFSEQAIKSWKDVRQILDNVLDTTIEMYKKKIADNQEMNLRDKRTILKRMGRKGLPVETDIEKLIKNLERMKGSYFPRMRDSGSWSVTMYNREQVTDEDGIVQNVDITNPLYKEYKSEKDARKAKDNFLKNGYDEAGTHYTFKDGEIKRTPERLAGYTVAGQTITNTNQFITQLLTKMDKVFMRDKIKSFDAIPDVKSSYNYQKKDGTLIPQLCIAILDEKDPGLYGYAFKSLGGAPYSNEEWFVDRSTNRVKKLSDWVLEGKNRKFVENNYQPTRVWHFNNPSHELRRNIVFAINKGRANEYVRHKLEFEYQLIQNEYELLMENTYQSSLIRRSGGTGNGVFIGYETDIPDVIRSYTKKIASGIATSHMAGNMISALHGTADASPYDFENIEDFIKLAQSRKIDPILHKNRYDRSLKYISDLLDRNYTMEKYFAMARALVAVKYMGLSVFSGGVNLTSLATSSPVVLNNYVKMPINQAPEYIKRACELYLIYKKNPDKLVPMGHPGLAALFQEMQYKDWNRSEMNEEASAVGIRSMKWIDSAIRGSLIFMRLTEEMNRLATMGASYLYMEDMYNKGYVALNSSSNAPDINVFTNLRRVTEYKKNIYNIKLVDNNETTGLHELYVDIAKETSDVANGVYGQSNKLYRAQGKTGFAKLVASQAMFLKYIHTQLLNFAENGYEFKNKKNAIYMILAPVILGGLRASPIWGPISPMIYKLIQFLTGDDDPEEEFYRMVGNEMGKDPERFMRDGLIGTFTPVTIRNSLAFQMPTPMSGIPYSLYKDVTNAATLTIEGDYGRAIERANIRAVSSALRAHREYTQGATTLGGKPFWLGTEQIKPTFTQAMIMVFGGNPVEYSYKKEQLWKDQIIQRRYTTKRHKINSKFIKADSPSDWQNAMDEALKYNQTIVNHRLFGLPFITDASIKSALDNPPDKFQLGRYYRLMEVGEEEEEETNENE